MAKTSTTKKTAPTAKSLHLQLQDIVNNEMAGLPELLEQLEPKERVRTILALLPYVTPKVETVGAGYGEPFGWDL